MLSITRLFDKSDTKSLILQIVLGVIAIAASAQISIPLKPVNITLQTLVVMAIGLTYTKNSSVATMLLYLFAGAIGAPIFTGWKSGIACLTGPSAGYLLGMLMSSYVMPFMRQYFKLSNLYNCLLGSLLIYTLGISWLSTFIGFENAIYSGFIIYIPTGLVKIALLVGILRTIQKG
jgi:biotin transport system substrate-specific component